MTFIYCILVPMAVFSFSIVASDSLNLENMEVVRYIDISTQLLTVDSHIKVWNNSTDPIDNYVYIVDSEWANLLAFIEVLDDKKNPLFFQRNPIIEHSGTTLLQYNIFLPKPISSGETTNFVVSLIVTNYLKSLPKSVKQNEKHMVLFPFNVYYHTMYFSHVQTSYLYMGTTKAALIDGAKYRLAEDSEYGLQYGPFKEIEPYKYTQSVFHYENNSPFLVAERVKRYIKLSHWGFISVWDQIELYHSGPKFIGPFKRSYKNDKDRATQDTKIEGFHSTLPHYAFDIYLKDDIGLIWSYQVDYDDPKGVVVSVVPRHILYGGWKTNYEIGYSLRISDYVTSHGNDEYSLNFPLMDKIFDTMIIREAEINIILPEGANLKSKDPHFDVANGTDTKYCYYFDNICREMITLRRYNLVEKNIIDLSVVYTFPPINLVVKPLTIAMYLYLIFIISKVLTHISIVDEKQIRPGVKPNEFLVSSTAKKKNKRNLKQKQI